MEDVLSTAKGGGQRTGAHSAEGKVAGGEGGNVGGRMSFNQMQIKADCMQTDMSNFCVCSLGGVWSGTSNLGEMLLENMLSTHKKDP